MATTMTAPQTVEVKKITRRTLSGVEVSSHWSLPVILLFQTLVSLLFLQNTPFQDEALYVYAGRQIVQHWFGAPGVVDNYSFYFSGNPFVYPVIGGALDLLGGMALARLFSLLCMLIVTACGYYVTTQLFDQKSAIFAGLFFVCQAPVLFLSRLATYDPMCLCLIALATALAVYGTQTKRAWTLVGIGPLLVLAFGTKYAALLFIPSVLALLLLFPLLRRGVRGTVLPAILGTGSMVVTSLFATLIVLHFDPAMLHALSATTTNRIVIEAYSRPALVLNVLQLVGLSYLVGLLGLLFVRKKELLLALLLLGSALLVPAYHIYKAELISLDKHLGFSMFFLMPVAGYALARISGFRPGALSFGRYILSGLAICLILFIVAIPQAEYMYNGWPPTTELTNVLKTQVRQGDGHYLVQQFEVSRYNLREETYNWQWVGLDSFQYTDKQGHYYENGNAYVKAINDGYFDLIQLDYANDTSTAMLIYHALVQSQKYELVTKIPYKDVYGTGYFWIWGKR